MRTWPAIEVSRLKPAATGGPDLLQAALVDYRIAAIDESAADLWRVFFSKTPSAIARRRTSRAFPTSRAAARSADELGHAVQADLRAVRIGNIIVAPPWDSRIPASSNWITRRSLGRQGCGGPW